MTRGNYWEFTKNTVEEEEGTQQRLISCRGLAKEIRTRAFGANLKETLISKEEDETEKIEESRKSKR